MRESINILDCTIRDGSYATNYYWDKNLLVTIVSVLSKTGVKYIEIGNGTGMGAYRKLSSALSDKEYYTNTIPFKGESLIGAFFIPGIGTIDDLSLFKESGGDFVRVGVNVTEPQRALNAIESAKNMGFFVCCNLMKTYAVSPYQLVLNSKEIVKSGVDCLYIVDSAGGMLPKQVKLYIESINDFYNVKIGFHGHNNLMLANANSLIAVECGAYMVDATLGGLGRGAGNAQIETLIAALHKEGYSNFEQKHLIELSDLSREIYKKNNKIFRGCSKREITGGLSNFHDSYTNLIEDVANKFNVDAELLISEVCKINVVNPTQELMESVAFKLLSGEPLYFPKFHHK